MSRIRRLRSVSLVFIFASLMAACGPAEQSAGPADGRVQLGEHENYKDFGRYVIHVNALTTDQLPPDVAKTYGIVRSGTRALLNVVVLKKVEGLTDQPVSGDISVMAANLTGQNKGMTMRKVTEQDAIYYIGEAAVSSREILIFDIDVVPENETEKFALRFKKEFFGG